MLTKVRIVKAKVFIVVISFFFFFHVPPNFNQYMKKLTFAGTEATHGWFMVKLVRQ